MSGEVPPAGPAGGPSRGDWNRQTVPSPSPRQARRLSKQRKKPIMQYLTPPPPPPPPPPPSTPSQRYLPLPPVRGYQSTAQGRARLYLNRVSGRAVANRANRALLESRGGLVTSDAKARYAQNSIMNGNVYVVTDIPHTAQMNEFVNFSTGVHEISLR